LQNKCLELDSLQHFSSNICNTSFHSKNTYNIIPFTFERIKFPVKLNFAIIIKSQGQPVKFWSLINKIYILHTDSCVFVVCKWELTKKIVHSRK